MAPCVGYISKEDYGEIIDGVIEFLSGDTRPILRELERKMREAAAEERFEEAARYRNRLLLGPAPRRAAGGGPARRRHVDVIGVAVEGDRAAVQVFPLRGGKMIDRYAFHLENVGGQDLTTVLEAFCLEYYGSAPACRRRSSCRRDAGDLAALERVPLRAARLARRGAAPRARREAAARGARGGERPARARVGRRPRPSAAAAARRGARGAARGAQPRGLPMRIECFDISTIQGESIVGSMVVFEDAVPKKAHYRKFGVRGAGRARTTSRRWREVISRRFARLARAGRAERLRRGLRGGAEPRRDRRRQGPALGGARGDAGVRPAARRRDRAREARWRRCSCRAAPTRSCSTATRRGCSCCSGSATRRTASRSASTASGARRKAFESIFDELPGRRAGAAPRAAAALRLGRALPGRHAGGARGRARRAGEDRARDLRAAAQGRRRVREHSTPARRPRRPARGAGCGDDGATRRRSRHDAGDSARRRTATFQSRARGKVLERLRHRRPAAGTTDAMFGAALDARRRSRCRRRRAACRSARPPATQLAERARRSSRRAASYKLASPSRRDAALAVAAITGQRCTSDRPNASYGAYAVPLASRRTASWKIELGGTVTFGPLTPEPELASRARRPTIASEVTAERADHPQLAIWVDDQRIARTSLPTSCCCTARRDRRRSPSGRHTVVTFAATQSSAGANAYVVQRLSSVGLGRPACGAGRAGSERAECQGDRREAPAIGVRRPSA